MKVIIAGSRSLAGHPHLVGRAVQESGFADITEVVSGTARGIDQLGEEWAKLNGKKVTRFPADWKRLGKQAGFARNRQMAEYADALIAIWDGYSHGTKHMIQVMKETHGKPVFILGLGESDEL